MIARARRTRARLSMSTERPRLSVFRSSKHIRGQVVDITGKVIASASDEQLKDKKGTGVTRAAAVGKLIAERALAKKVTTVAFDKGPYSYHGQVKSFADGAREGGLQF